MASKFSQPKSPEVCPVCGEDVPAGSLACPECGADHNSGWRDNAAVYDALDLPDHDFNHDEFAGREFGNPSKPAGIKPIWWMTAILLLILVVIFFVFATRF